MPNGGRPIGVPRRDQVDRVASVGPFAQLRVTRGAAANEPEVVELADGLRLMEGRQNDGPHRWRWWRAV